MRYRISSNKLGSTGRSLFLGFVKLHILHHAGQTGTYGLEMLGELAHHGYELSPGTLYPIFHKMQRDGLLKRRDKNVDGKIRKYYRATPKGERALADGFARATELLHEISPQFEAQGGE